MSFEAQNITPEQATVRSLALQISGQDLQFCILTDKGPIRSARYGLDSNLPLSATVSQRIRDEEVLRLPYKKICLIPVTEKVCLVPAELTTPEGGQAYMQAHGIPVGQDDQIIRTDPVQGIAAYIVLPQPVWQELQALYGQRMQVLHPLQIAARKTHQGPTVEINFAGDWANITVKDVRLQYCEVLPCTEAAELLFYLQQLNKQYDLQDYDLLITGEGIEQIRKILKGYYRKTLVDKELRSSLPKALRNEEINHNNIIYCFDADR